MLTLNSLQVLAKLINKLELSYGRLAADGEEKAYKKIITLDELLQLETTFCENVKKMLESTNLFDFFGWSIICYLLECFDSSYAETYLKVALENDFNILRYLDKSIATWTGSSIEYEISNGYQKYLTEERVLHAIQTHIKTGTLFEFSEEIQNKCAAFFLNSNRKLNYRGHVSQSDVDKQLAVWQE